MKVLVGMTLFSKFWFILLKCVGIIIIVIVWFSEKQQHSPLSVETGTSQSWELEALTRCVFPLLISMELICCIQLVPNKISSCIRPYYDLLQTQCGYNPLTSGVTYSSFPLTISPHCQVEGWWEDRKKKKRRLGSIVGFYTNFSELEW